MNSKKAETENSSPRFLFLNKAIKKLREKLVVEVEK
ncbi:MAG: hypothetical protein Ct9H300mP4_14720 [Gammaproteobacteria bacterium]|nr:MAG: hypothetical protein Ct9H300mP4_14720 [Gammaproteobacteria bacterium]